MTLADIAQYLPTIATALVNPVAGVASVAAQFLGPKLGVGNTVQEVTQKLMGMSGEDMVKLKSLDVELKEHLADNDLKADQMELADVADARARDIANTKTLGRNWTAISMYVLAVFGILVLMYVVITNPSINEYAKGIITFGLGRLWGYLDGIYQFEFGTTRSSRTKDDTINKLSG
jgi:hypothetical protein